MWPTDKRENSPTEQDQEMIQMLKLSNKTFKITEKYVKGSSEKGVIHLKRWKILADITIFFKSKNSRNEKYIRDKWHYYLFSKYTEV